MTLTIFVDDSMIFAHCTEHANIVISALKEIFEIVIGETDMFVGIQIIEKTKVYFCIKKRMLIESLKGLMCWVHNAT